MQALGEVSPEYDDCPDRCPIDYENKKPEGGFCEDCPIAEIQAEYKALLLDELASIKQSKWSADYLRRLVFEVMDIEKSDVELTESAERLVGILRSERMRIERIERWNKRQSNGNGEQ